VSGDAAGVSGRALVRRLAPGLSTLMDYQRGWLRYDVAAGLSVVAIALPVGIAYSDLAGVPAVYGIYAAIFPLIAYAIFGSSRQLMVGPDAATCFIVAASLGPLAGGDPERYLGLMFVLTLAVGVFYIAGGILRLGFIANFLSLPILAGFLNGIALLIVAGQLSKLLGYESSVGDFFPKLIEFVETVGDSHGPTAILGLALLAALVALRRVLPRLPNPLIVVALGVVAVVALDLDAQGVAVIGTVPAGIPDLPFVDFDFATIEHTLRDAAGIMLVSFTSGVLTAKSFARRNRYEIDANQEMIGFGAANIASGLAGSFAITGADSRTAVNNSMNGKSQLVGIIAAVTMLAILFVLTAPLAYVPTAALAAVIIVAAVGLFDLPALKEWYAVSYREFALSVGTTLGVLVFGVLPGVLIAVALSLLWLLSIESRPQGGVIGKVKGLKGFHDLAEHLDVKTAPGLVLFRYNANLVFFNVDNFRDRILQTIAAAETPVEWFVVDASPVNIVDGTALTKIRELRQDLALRGTKLAFAGVKPYLNRYFNPAWVETLRSEDERYDFPTLKAAVRAFENRKAAPSASESPSA